MKKHIFSFDAETNGLWGQPFAIAAKVYERQPKRELWGYGWNYIGQMSDHFIRLLNWNESVPRPEEVEKGRFSRLWEKVTAGSQWRDTRGSFDKREFEWVCVDKIVLRLPDTEVTNEWVKENVLPTLVDLPVTHETYAEMLSAFAAFYFQYRSQETEFIVHMGTPVESGLIRDMYTAGLIGEWDGPYPLHDVASMLLAKGFNPTSVDEYAKEKALTIEPHGSTHNPLYDCEVAARVFIDLMK